MSNKYSIEHAIDNMNNLDRGQLDILNEFLHNESWASEYVQPDQDYPDPKKKNFFPTISAFLNSDHFGKESIKHYLMFRSRFLLSKTR